MNGRKVKAVVEGLTGKTDGPVVTYHSGWHQKPVIFLLVDDRKAHNYP